MRYVYENNQLRKVELSPSDKGYLELFNRMRNIIDIEIPSSTISLDSIKNEFTMYFYNNPFFYDLNLDVYLGKDTDNCIMFGLKYNLLTRQYRVKKYYKGNYLKIETNDIVFHTGICPLSREYTLYVFENQEEDDVRRGFSKQSTENYYGRTYSKDGKFIRESFYTHE